MFVQYFSTPIEDITTALKDLDFVDKYVLTAVLSNHEIIKVDCRITYDINLGFWATILVVSERI